MTLFLGNKKTKKKGTKLFPFFCPKHIFYAYKIA